MVNRMDSRLKERAGLARDVSSVVSKMSASIADHKHMLDSFCEAHRERFQDFVSNAPFFRASTPVSVADMHSDSPHQTFNLFSRRERHFSKGRRGSSAGLPLAAISSSSFSKTPSIVFSKDNDPRREGYEGNREVAFDEWDVDRPESITSPSLLQLVQHPIALLRTVPKDAALFIAGAVAGAVAKTTTAPLDRWKLMIQVKNVQPGRVVPPMEVNLLQSFLDIGREGGVQAYWRGNLPQVMRIVPYSAVQLFAYEFYKGRFMGDRTELTVPSRLAAGACAGMTSTLVTYPLDVLRLRMALETSNKGIAAVAMTMVREEGFRSLYRGLGPSLVSIAPYIALNFCAYDIIKRRLPAEYRSTPQASLLTALAATTIATVSCYPIDTVRRQMQMKGSSFSNMIQAFPAIVKRDGWPGLYRGFIANSVKNLPNSSVRLTTYDSIKQAIHRGHGEWERLTEERRRQAGNRRKHRQMAVKASAAAATGPTAAPAAGGAPSSSSRRAPMVSGNVSRPNKSISSSRPPAIPLVTVADATLTPVCG